MSGGLIWAGHRIALSNMKIIVRGYIIWIIIDDKKLPIKLANVQDEWYNSMARWKKYYVPRQTRSSCSWAKLSAFIKWKNNSILTTLHCVIFESHLQGRSSFLWVILKKMLALHRVFYEKPQLSCGFQVNDKKVVRNY